MSGLLALLDDVAAQAMKAGSKAAGVVIDDTAVTPKYVHGFEAKRELPIIGRIALGSLKNKLLILLPAALVLTAFLPGAITPLLMIGGAYLCFEGAEKLFHMLWPHADPAVEEDFADKDPAHLEEEKVRGAIKTDFILSAEIMTIALAALPESAMWLKALSLALVGAGITVAVYGTVALIVKMDDIGLFMARKGRLSLTRAAGRGLVVGMPKLMALLSTVGTAAMLWVGGSIVIHGLEELGWGWLGHHIHDWAAGIAHAVPVAEGAVEWAVKATLDGLFGVGLGLLIIPLATRLVGPMIASVMGKAPH